jgi:hypothetical protein
VLLQAQVLAVALLLLLLLKLWLVRRHAAASCRVVQL